MKRAQVLVSSKEDCECRLLDTESLAEMVKRMAPLEAAKKLL